MAAAWSDDVWQMVIQRMRADKLTPVIGAGVSAAVFGTGAELAESWADAVPYPFDDRNNLATVAQYVAVTGDRARPGEYIAEKFGSRLEDVVVFDAFGEHHPYRALTGQPIPVWLTTNYDDLIVRALATRNKTPRIGASMWTRQSFPWHNSTFDVAGFTPSVKSPLVFHLHGTYQDSRSMVITEGDYLEFLEQMMAERVTDTSSVLPPVVKETIATTSLLFIGYGLRDVNVHLLLRQWDIRRTAFVVRPVPAGLTPAQEEKYRGYYPSYLSDVTGIAKVQMYWGTAEAFCAELRDAISRGVS